jgi:sorbitol-specific phosphotransferase system component IIBC
LLVEERRIVESIAGNENLEIQWRLATLKEAKAVVTQYHKYLSENSLIKTVVETDGTAAGGSFTSLGKQ